MAELLYFLALAAGAAAIGFWLYARGRQRRLLSNREDKKRQPDSKEDA